jgi:hypothetical protein
MRCVTRSAFATVAFAAFFAVPPAPAAAQSRAATLGVQVVDIPAEYRQHTAYAGAGVFVAAVLPGSPAETAHVLPGDVLQTLGDAPLTTVATFYTLASAAVPGVPVTLGVTRYGRALKLGVTPAGVDAFFSAPAACRAGNADALMADSIAAGRRHDPAAEAGAAERALNLYESCASVNGLLDQNVLIKSGDALLSQAVAAVSQADRAAAVPFAGNAVAIYAQAARAGFVSETDKSVARAKIGAIERAFPEARSASGDGSIALGLRTLAESQTANPVTVLGTWSEPPGDTDTIVHLRVDLHPEHEAHLFVQGFKITIISRYIGPQAIYASDEPPPEAPGGILRSKSDVDPREDFRAVRRADMAPGEHRVYVLSFVVPNDSEFSNAADTLQYAPR